MLLHYLRYFVGIFSRLYSINDWGKRLGYVFDSFRFSFAQWVQVFRRFVPCLLSLRLFASREGVQLGVSNLCVGSSSWLLLRFRLELCVGFHSWR